MLSVIIRMELSKGLKIPQIYNKIRKIAEYCYYESESAICNNVCKINSVSTKICKHFYRPNSHQKMYKRQANMKKQPKLAKTNGYYVCIINVKQHINITFFLNTCVSPQL